MSAADEMLNVAIPLAFTVFGEAGRFVYKPVNGTPIPLTASIETETFEDDENSHGKYIVGKRMITFCTDPASSYGGVAAPAMNATATVDGIEYSICEIGNATDKYVDVLLKRYMPREIHAAGYHGQSGNRERNLR